MFGPLPAVAGVVQEEVAYPDLECGGEVYQIVVVVYEGCPDLDVL